MDKLNFKYNILKIVGSFFGYKFFEEIKVKLFKFVIDFRGIKIKVVNFLIIEELFFDSLIEVGLYLNVSRIVIVKVLKNNSKIYKNYIVRVII